MYAKSSPNVTVRTLLNMKKRGEKITMLTSYDYTTARILSKSGVDVLLVGDSASNVFSGNKTTLPITLAEMLFLAKGVCQGNESVGGNSMVIFDMPFLSYHVSISNAIRNIGKVLKETTCAGVKLEGGLWLVPLIEELTKRGIPVMPHIGLMPQSIHRHGGYFLQGSKEEAADQLVNEAVELEKAGAFAILLEKIPATLGHRITSTINIPAIGIGAGPHMDGQVLVTNDLLGLNDSFHPKFVRKYASLEKDITSATQRYIQDVKSSKFPSKEESY